MKAKPLMLCYLEEWVESVKRCDGFSASERKRMLLSDA
jgi:hypothetical protein